MPQQMFSLTEGLTIAFRSTHINTGRSTISDGMVMRELEHPDGRPLMATDLVTGKVARLRVRVQDASGGVQ